MTKRTTASWLLAALALGLAVRTYRAWSASVIARDGITYVSMARDMATDWHAGIGPDLHFGYPLLIRCVQPLFGRWLIHDDVWSWQRTGQLISLVGGLACIPLVYWLGRRLLSRRVGLLAAWIWALLPEACRLSADALTDMPHLALVLAGLAATMIGLRVRSIGHLLWAGILSGAAYTFRPEGGEIALVAVVLVLVPRRATIRWRITAAMAVVAGFALFGGGYIWAEGGNIFSKKSLVLGADIMGDVSGHASGCLAMGSILPGPKSLALAGKELITHLSDTLNGVWLLLGVAYFFLRGRPAARRQWIIAPLVLWSLHMGLLLWLYLRHGYIAHRHVMLLNVGLVIFAAGSLCYWAKWLCRRAHHCGTSGSPMPHPRDAGATIRAARWLPIARRADAISLAVICLALIPWLLRDIHGGRYYIHDAAAWIKTACGERRSPVTVAQDGWVPFYAGLANWRLCPDPTYLFHVRELAEADLLILDIRDEPPSTIELLPDHVHVRLDEAARFTDERGRRGVVIYRATTIQEQGQNGHSG
jgi:hypothetical protein